MRRRKYESANNDDKILQVLYEIANVIDRSGINEAFEEYTDMYRREPILSQESDDGIRSYIQQYGEPLLDAAEDAIPKFLRCIDKLKQLV